MRRERRGRGGEGESRRESRRCRPLVKWRCIGGKYRIPALGTGGDSEESCECKSP